MQMGTDLQPGRERLSLPGAREIWEDFLEEVEGGKVISLLPRLGLTWRSFTAC